MVQLIGKPTAILDINTERSLGTSFGEAFELGDNKSTYQDGIRQDDFE